MKQLLSLLILFFIGCGVDATNPDPEEITGNVTVTVDTGDATGLSLTNAVTQNKGSFELFLESVELWGYSETEDLSAFIDLESESIDLLSNQGAVNLAKGKVKPGYYETVILNLVETKPFRYRPDGENEEDLEFEDTSYRSIIIETYIEVSGESEETIDLDFDILDSIKDLEGRKVFRPRVEGFRRKRTLSYRDTISYENGEKVCAYLYAPIKPEKRPRPGEFGPPPPPTGFEGLEKPSFDSEEELVLDETPECENAFDETEVEEDQSYFFERLKPGYYTFRLFLDDDTFVDIAEKIELKPEKPEKKLFHQSDGWEHWDEEEFE